MENNNRDVTLDFAKGILAMLVVLGHSIQFSFGLEYSVSGDFFDNVLFKTIYSFHMPLFMLISGYLFYFSNRKDLKTLFISKLKSLGIPMMVFVLLCWLPEYARMIKNGLFEVVRHYLSTIFCGWTMWFLFSILLNIVIVSILTRVFKKRKCQYITMTLLFLISLFVSDNVLLSVDKFMFPFFCIGYVIRDLDIDIYVCSRKVWAMVLLTIASVAAVCCFDYDTYIYNSGFCITNDWPRTLFLDMKRMVIALVVSYTFMQYVHMLSIRDSGQDGFFARLGQMSLFVYGLNCVNNFMSPKIYEMLGLSVSFNYVVALLSTVVFLTVAYFLFGLFEKNRITRIIFLGK